jgi:Tfp pilus assembly protein PilO
VNRRTLAIFAVGAVAIVALWWFLVYSPKGDDLSAAQDERDEAALQQDALQAQLDELEEIAANGPAIDAELAELSGLVPPTSDLAGFIIGMNDLAIQSGIDWISVAPNPPEAEGPGLSTIDLNISIEGGFFQVVDYLNRLEDFDRLVIVDTMNISSSSGSAEDGTTAATGTLGVTLTGRMFTTEAPAPAPGTPGAGATTTTTVAGPTTTVAGGSATTGTTGAVQ